MGRGWDLLERGRGLGGSVPGAERAGEVFLLVISTAKIYTREEVTSSLNTIVISLMHGA